jgi:hypothetical protein
VSDATDIGGAFRPATREGTRAFVLTPFARVARTHGVAAVGDAMVAAALAGSLFFAAPGGEARGPVLRYLVITMLPFSVLSPLIGPAIDRMKGGHRLMVLASAVMRAVACWFMAMSVSKGDWTFFVYALILLVFQKAYSVARSALVPSVVRSEDELVKANSKLALISGIASVVGVLPAALVIKIPFLGPGWALRLAMVVYIVAAVMAFKIPPVQVADEAADPTERMELKGATIFMAGSAMGLIRGSVGFMMFLIAFAFTDGGKPTIGLAVVGGALAAFQQVGNLLAPRIRDFTNEENLLTGVLALIVVGGLLSLFLPAVGGGFLVGATVGFAAAAGKLAFDSILQRDAPDANRGRAFARFETRFQIFWVCGALIPVAFHLSAGEGYVIVLIGAVFALFTYALSRLSYAHETGASQTIATARAAELDAKIGEMSTVAKDRLAAMPRAAFRKLRTGRVDDGDEWDDGQGDGYWDDDDSWDEDAHWDDPDDHRGYDDYDDDEWDPHRAPVADGGADQRPLGGDAPSGVFDQFASNPDRVSAAEGDSRRGRRRGRPSGSRHLADASPVAWDPDEDDRWRDHDDPRGGRDYLAELDPSVDNPFPWSPDDPTRPD